MEKLKLLNKADLLKSTLETRLVDLGNGEGVYVKEMSGIERDLFEQSLLLKTKVQNNVTYEQDLNNFRAKLAVMTVCDEKGVLLFKPEEAASVGRILGGLKMERIIKEAQDLNKITEDDKKALAKKSGATRRKGSSSSSAVN